MKKIGILIYDFSAVGGAEKVAKNLANEFSKKNEVFVITLFETVEKEHEAKYRYIKMFEKKIGITVNLMKISKKLKKILIDNSIDILLLITAGVNTVGVLSTIGTRVKTIYCEHSNLENRTYGKKHIFRQWIGAKFADMIVTLTDRDKTNFKIKFAVKDSKVISIPNWVENSLNLSKYDIFSKKIITVGRLERVKGYDKLIEVAKIVKMYHPDWKWDIFGNGSMYEELNEKIKKEELEDFLFLKGNTKNIENIYRQYSFFVMTSYYEGLPLVLLEAQMNSLPIISFDCPTGPSEIIDNDENGYLIKCYDVKQMANKIIDLIECEQIRKSFSIKSDKNLKKYSKQEVLKKWNDLIVSM